jgi:hypothetical protein
MKPVGELELIGKKLVTLYWRNLMVLFLLEVLLGVGDGG